jgi:hypothetical protein
VIGLGLHEAMQAVMPDIDPSCIRAWWSAIATIS